MPGSSLPIAALDAVTSAYAIRVFTTRDIPLPTCCSMSVGRRICSIRGNTPKKIFLIHLGIVCVVGER